MVPFHPRAPAKLAILEQDYCPGCKITAIKDKEPAIMMKLHRNMSICNGDKSCGECLQILPPLEHGDMAISDWVMEDPENEQKISTAIIQCPVGALEVVG